jgi:hypothetical protein
MAAGGKLPAAAIANADPKLLGSFAFSSFNSAALGNHTDDNRVIGGMQQRLDAGRQNQLGNVDAFANLQGADINGDEFRQILGQTVNFQLGHDVIDQTVGELDARCGVFVNEVERHLDVQFVGGINALEVNVQNLQFVGVTLGVAQQNLFFLAINDEVDDGRVEGFLLQLQQQIIVIQFDVLRGSAGTVNDTRDFGRTTQAAARTRSLQCTRLRDQFELHVILQWFAPIRDQTKALKKSLVDEQ